MGARTWMRLVALVTGPVDLGGAAVQYSVGPASLRAGVVGQSPSGLCALRVGRGWLVSFVFAVWREALELVLLCARQRAAGIWPAYRHVLLTLFA